MRQMFGGFADTTLGHFLGLTEAEPVQARLLRIILHMEPASQGRKPHPMHWSLSQFIHDHHDQNGPETTGARRLQVLSRQLQHGHIPSLDDLLKDFPIDLDSPEARQMLARYAYFLTQAGPIGRKRAEQLGLAVHIRSQKSLIRKLQSLLGDVMPQTPEMQLLQSRIYGMQTAIGDLAGLLEQSLEHDTSQGRSVDMNRKPALAHRWLERLKALLERPLRRLEKGFLR